MILLLGRMMENTFTTAQTVDQPRRILALDFGARNIGLADLTVLLIEYLPIVLRNRKLHDVPSFLVFEHELHKLIYVLAGVGTVPSFLPSSVSGEKFRREGG